MKFKRTVLLMMMIILFSPLFSDIFVNGKNLNRDNRVKFMELIINSGNIANSKRIFVKFGPSINNLSESGEITTQTGKKISLKSGIKANFFFTRNGWKYISSYMQCKNGNKTEYYFFKKISEN